MNEKQRHPRRIKRIEGTAPPLEPKCYKIRHPNRDAAERAIASVLRVNRKLRIRGEMAAYFCTSCDGWHIGHVRPWLNGPKRRRR